MQLAKLWRDHGLVLPNQLSENLNRRNLTARYFNPIPEHVSPYLSVRLHPCVCLRASAPPAADPRHTGTPVLLKVASIPN
jgi:hypothetical protein